MSFNPFSPIRKRINAAVERRPKKIYKVETDVFFQGTKLTAITSEHYAHDKSHAEKIAQAEVLRAFEFQVSNINRVTNKDL